MDPTDDLRPKSLRSNDLDRTTRSTQSSAPADATNLNLKEPSLKEPNVSERSWKSLSLKNLSLTDASLKGPTAQELSLKDAASSSSEGTHLRDEITRLQRIVAELLLINQKLREQLLGSDLGGEFGAKA